MKFNRNKLKRAYTSVEADINVNEDRLAAYPIRSQTKQEGEGNPRIFNGYNPDAVDFIRRCDTNKQAEEIIDFLEKRGEISLGQARDLKKQLETRGLRSFGSKKQVDHYSREGMV
jgi:hypothetical protein